MRDPGDFKAGIAAISTELGRAAEAILTAVESCQLAIADARRGEVAAFDLIEFNLCEILQACAFQDLVGQRLGNLEAALDDGGSVSIADPLLNGPALPGSGVSQSDADAMFSTPGR